MNTTKTLRSTNYKERKKRSHDGAAAAAGTGILLEGLRKHKLDIGGGSADALCDPLLKNGNKRVVIKPGSIKNDWLGLWKAPLRNPFNMYGTLPSQIMSRDKRKTFSYPPLTDGSGESTDAMEIGDCIDSIKISSVAGEDAVAAACKDGTDRLPVTGSLDVNRISTMLSEPKSSRSSITASTARSTIDSFRYSDSFDDLVPEGEVGPSSSSHLEVLLNNLYVTTGNGFLSGSLPENPWKNKNQVDADFIAVSLARKRHSNPGLLLFHDLEAIVSAPSRYCRCGFSHLPHHSVACSLCVGAISNRYGSVSPSNTSHGLKSPRLSSPALRNTPSNDSRAANYKISSEEELLLWSASTDSARATICRSGVIQRPVKFDVNDDFMVTDADDYAALQTRFGRIIYSPKFKDQHYMYRFVVLTKEAQEAVEALSRTLPNNGKLPCSYVPSMGGKRYLTEFEIVRQLGIQMSPGWEHFMYFKNSQKELVLRKRL
ncbi:cyclin-dependent kinase regulatory subunit [Babesia ovata]|uniref:Cyclin-dependent kinases regulatory subunit n=1 Tax=Babesia ovata TaxID=189622 RepID=A0A2H6KH90_9APIC|nr:cyclin-dependent kinase regulatory subunit [Babesia ovata]GBE62358.1 cyclin-dependent kinase regulatory subunit [Babesia ovata]